MASRSFKPEIQAKYTNVEAYDPQMYKGLGQDTLEDKSFGELFHEIYRCAVNLYDVAKNGPGHEKPAMELFTTTVITYIIGVAAWLDGQAATPPSPDQVRAAMLDIRKQAFRYEYETGDPQRPAVSHLVASMLHWFVPRLYAIQAAAVTLKDQLRVGRTTVRVRVDYEITLDVAESAVKEYLAETASKELFSGDNVVFKKVVIVTEKK